MKPKAHNWRSMIAAIAILTWAILTCSGTVSFADDPIKTLIVDGSNNHDWRATTPVIAEMMEASGRFTVDVSTCPQNRSRMGEYKPEFAKYDLVVVNNGNNANNWVRETEVTFEEFVAAGGGVVIYHAADNAWPDWKAYNEMIGIGGWGKRDHTAGPYIYMDKEGNVIRDVSKGKTGGHGRQEPFLITVREPEHPIMKGMPKSFMHGTKDVGDEMYAFLRGPGKNMTILATAHSPTTNGGSGHEEPMLMTIEWGKGRIFHTMLGHAVIQIRLATFKTTFLRGAQWAATGDVTIPLPEGFPE